MDHSSLFTDRTDAGHRLAEALGSYRRTKAIILGLPRGGLEVGRSLADDLSLPLYPFVVRKIGHPFHREFAVGALAEGGATWLDEATIQRMGIAWDDLEAVIEEEMQELKRRREAYGVADRPPLKSKIVLLVDDGAATGSSLFAAIEDLRKQKVRQIVVALPVCPSDTKRALEEKADEVHVLLTPAFFNAVGEWYLSFPQLTDERVQRLLSKRHVASKGSETP